MRYTQWLCVLLVGIVACASKDGGAGSPAVGPDSFIDDDGTVKDRGGPGVSAPTDIGLSDNVVRVRCHVSTEGALFGCSQLSGPPIMEDRIVTALKGVHVKPIIVNGESVEGTRNFSFRVRFLMP